MKGARQQHSPVTFVLLAATVMLVLSGCFSDDGNVKPSKEVIEARQKEASRINTRLGAGYLRRGQYELAHEKLQKAVAFDENNVQAHSTLAILYEQIGDYEQARKYHRRAVEIGPQDASAQNNFGAFLCKVGDYRKAEEHFLLAARNPFYDNPEVALINAGRCVAKIPDLDTAEQHLREALSISNNDPEALYLLASVKYQQRQYLSARGFLQRYEAIAEPDRSALILGYRVERALKDHARAEEYSRQLEARYPGSTASLHTEDSS